MKIKVLVTVDVDDPEEYAEEFGIPVDEVEELVPYQFNNMAGMSWSISEAVLFTGKD